MESSSDGDDGSSENEQPEVESEPGVPEEETEPETEPELVNCPNGSQAATTEECGTGTGTDYNTITITIRNYQMFCGEIISIPILANLIPPIPLVNHQQRQVQQQEHHLVPSLEIPDP